MGEIQGGKTRALKLATFTSIIHSVSNEITSL